MANTFYILSHEYTDRTGKLHQEKIRIFSSQEALEKAQRRTKPRAGFTLVSTGPFKEGANIFNDYGVVR